MSAKDRARGSRAGAGPTRSGARGGRAARSPAREAPDRRRPATDGGGAAPEPARANVALALFLVVGAGLVLQWRALGAGFFADDYLFLDQVRHRSLWAALASPDPIGNFVRPVGRQLAFWVLAHAGGERPAVFHAANLATFAAVLALLFALARRVAGARAGLIAAGFLALHEAADVPVLWASGSQDLLAVLFALAALLLSARGRPWWGALALLAALLAKETVAATPLVALVLLHRPGERWRDAARRAAPLALAWPAWALVWWLRGAPRTGGGALETHALARDALAALAHLAQTAAGLEWRAQDPTRGLRLGLALLLPAVALVIAALALVRRAPRRAGGVPAGVAWAVLGALPVAFVAPIWSGYYYLFALCGVALLLGALLGRARWGWAAVALAALAFGSNTARQLDEFSFARSAWAGESHVNRFYIARAQALMTRYLAQLRAMHPTLPRGSTVFFAHLPAFAGLQSADGPVLRWAYRDSSLRSYYLSGFAAAHGRTGPLFLFTALRDTLSELPMNDDELRSVVLSTMLNDDVAASRDACDRLLARHPDERQAHYWSAWLAWERGDRSGAEAELSSAGVEPTTSRAPEVSAALARLAARDTAGALALMEPAVERHPLDPNAHALLADLYAGRPGVSGGASVEAFAARVLAPDDARAWWRWGYLQARNERYEQAAHSLERALALGLSPGDAAAVRRMLDQLATVLPGSAAAREELRTTARQAH